MKKVLKIIEIPKELENDLLILNQEIVIKHIIDYLVDKLTNSSKDASRAWGLAKVCVKENWSEYCEDDTTLIIDWSSHTIKVMEL